jgi:hypothetical protein
VSTLIAFTKSSFKQNIGANIYFITWKVLVLLGTTLVVEFVFGLSQIYNFVILSIGLLLIQPFIIEVVLIRKYRLEGVKYLFDAKRIRLRENGLRTSLLIFYLLDSLFVIFIFVVVYIQLSLSLPEILYTMEGVIVAILILILIILAVIYVLIQLRKLRKSMNLHFDEITEEQKQEYFTLLDKLKESMKIENPYYTCILVKGEITGPIIVQKERLKIVPDCTFSLPQTMIENSIFDREKATERNLYLKSSPQFRIFRITYSILILLFFILFLGCVAFIAISVFTLLFSQTTQIYSYVYVFWPIVYLFLILIGVQILLNLLINGAHMAAVCYGLKFILSSEESAIYKEGMDKQLEDAGIRFKKWQRLVMNISILFFGPWQFYISSRNIRKTAKN